jgi:hypothetical protein
MSTPLGEKALAAMSISLDDLAANLDPGYQGTPSADPATRTSGPVSGASMPCSLTSSPATAPSPHLAAPRRPSRPPATTSRGGLKTLTCSCYRLRLAVKIHQSSNITPSELWRCLGTNTILKNSVGREIYRFLMPQPFWCGELYDIVGWLRKEQDSVDALDCFTQFLYVNERQLDSGPISGLGPGTGRDRGVPSG